MDSNILNVKGDIAMISDPDNMLGHKNDVHEGMKILTSSTTDSSPLL